MEAAGQAGIHFDHRHWAMAAITTPKSQITVIPANAGIQ
jgi:hypothetical protein